MDSLQQVKHPDPGPVGRESGEPEPVLSRPRPPQPAPPQYAPEQPMPEQPMQADVRAASLQRREQLRLQRRAQYGSPARVKLTIGSIIGVILGILAFLGVWWWLQRDVPAQDAESTAATEVTLESAPAGDEAQPEGEGSRADPDSLPAQELVNAQAGDAAGAEQVVAYIAGAVQEPQVVYLRSGQRVIDAVDMAGGLNPDAAADAINLAAVVEDGTFLRIPTEEELEDGDQSSLVESATLAESGTGGSSSQSEETELINLNTADETQLQELPGIGPALAERIIRHRETAPEFTALEDLAAVSGIGPAILGNIADMVTW